MSDIREKLIREKVDLINTIDYAMRDFDDYLDECNETCTPPIDKLEDVVTEDITAMLAAMCVFVNKTTGSDDELIDFTYLLNRLAIQRTFMEEDDNG